MYSPSRVLRTTMVRNIPFRSSKSKNGMPCEDDYNGAIAHILKHVLRYHVSTPLDCSLGKTDVVVSYEDGTTCAIESILAAQPPVSSALS